MLEGNNRSYIIELEKVTSVSVKKTYSSIRPGELNNKGIEEFLKTIELKFEYNSNKRTICLPFFDCEKDDSRNLPRLERNAKNWQLILSKMALIHPERQCPVVE